MTAHDPLVRSEVAALARGVSLKTIRVWLDEGKLPPQHQTPSRVRAWPMSVLRAHDPHLARRCAAILAALDSIPLKKAA